LSQTTFVREYQAQFENLTNRVNGLFAPFYLSGFIYGLKSEIRREVIPSLVALKIPSIDDEHLDLQVEPNPTPSHHRCYSIFNIEFSTLLKTNGCFDKRLCATV